MLHDGRVDGNMRPKSFKHSFNNKSFSINSFLLFRDFSNMVLEQFSPTMDSSSISIMDASSSPSKFAPVTFNHSISIRLDNNNLILWRK